MENNTIIKIISTKKCKMKKNDYIKALKIPSILLLLNVIFGYILSTFIYKNVSTYEQVISSLDSVAILSVLLMFFSYSTFFYAGWIIVSKFSGTVKNSIFIGLMLWCIQFILSTINTVLMYATISGYKIGLAPYAQFWDNILVVIIFGTIFAIPFTLVVDAGISGLGGFIAKKRKK